MANQSGSVLSAGILIVGLLGTGLWMSGRPPAPASRTMRLGATVPAGDALGAASAYPSIAVSPDGSKIAYIATHEGVQQLYVRDANSWIGKPVPGTENAHTPFFSPDGQWMGAVLDHKLVKLPVGGGPVTVVATVPFEVYGVSWSADGWIYFGSAPPLGLMKTRQEGGSIFEVIRYEPKLKDVDQRFPEVLPGGQALLFAGRKEKQSSMDDADIEAVSLKDSKRHVVIKGGTNPRYLASGHLLFMRGGNLMAVGFDPRTLQVKGTPSQVIEGIQENPSTGAGQYSVSAEGSLAYLPGAASFGERELVSVDRGGAVHAVSAKKQAYADLSVSPDGRLLAITIEGSPAGVFLHDIAKDSDAAFTPGEERRAPIWSPDGKRLYFDGPKLGEWAVYWKPLDGSHAEDEYAGSETPAWPRTFAPDGERMVYDITAIGGNIDMGIHLSKPAAADLPMMATPANEGAAQISPDGKWMAFQSDVSGRMEIYITNFPELTARINVSADGGVEPRWSKDGRELFYRSDARSGYHAPFARSVKMMAVPIEISNGAKPGTPHMLFDGPYAQGVNDYALAPDGKGFLMIRESPAAPAPVEVRMILNWAEELARHVPSN